jgi:hypothetical protein
MGSLSNYAEDAMLDHVLNTTAMSVPTNLYVGLSTATIDDTTTGSTVTEPGDTYARVVHNSWDTAATRKTSNTGTVTFATATGSWGTITDWFIADAATLGNIIAYGTLAVSKAVASGNTPSFADDELDVTFNASGASGGWTDFLCHEMLDHVFKVGSWTAPTDLYFALFTVSPTDSTFGTECAAANNYSRAQYTGTWSASSGGASDNDAVISFPTPSGSWGTVIAAGACDAASGTNLLLYGDTTSQEPTNGDTVQIPAGDFNVTLA